MELKNLENDFRNLLSAAVKDGLKAVNSIKAETYLFGRYYGWPQLSYYNSIFPSFSEGIFSGPIDYKQAFGDIGQSPRIRVESLPTFVDFSNFCLKNPTITERIFSKKHYKKEYQGEEYNETIKFVTLRIPTEIIDRYIHVYNSFGYSDDQFLEVYNPYSKSIFSESLSFDLCIPILLTKFDFDELSITENVIIEKMKEKFQLARFPLKAYGPMVHNSVLGAATHMLVLKDWSIKNSDHVELERTFSNISSYPLSLIDSFFGAFRIVTGLNSGYAQVLVRPHDWAIDYKATLPPLQGTSVRAYPPYFEEYYWNREDLPEISKSWATEIGQFYIKLSSIKENAIEIAVRRLNRCFLRDDEQDSLLDTIIALETLLSDDEKQELTHKLSMRVAALSRYFFKLNKTPIEVFKDIKAIYSYRSVLLHGSKSVDKKREIKQKNKQPIPATTLAIEYLRLVLKTFIENPEIRSASAIDELLLMRN